MTLILQILALACLVIAAFGLVTKPSRISYGWLGLCLWLLSLMLVSFTLHTVQ